MVMLSVIIPMYNAEKYITETLQSVLEQPCKDLEVIVIDDGSIDDSLLKCQEIVSRDNRVKVYHYENGGVTRARTRGVEKSAGKYFVYLDADDKWVKDSYTCPICEVLEGDFDIVAFGHYMSNQDATKGKETFQLDGIFDGDSQFAWHAHEGHIGTAFYKREKYKAYDVCTKEWYVKLKYGEDRILEYAYWTLAEKIRCINKPLYIYRQNSTSVMHNINVNIVEYMTSIIEGWKNMGIWLEAYSQEGARNCKTMTSGLTLELAKLYSQEGANKKQLETVIRNSPCYSEFLNAQIDYFNHQNRKAYELYRNHRTFFNVKYKIIGMVERIGKQIFSIKMLNEWRNARKFPVQI